MSNDNFIAPTTGLIRFAEGGFVGADTNGAVPTPVLGLVIDSEIYADDDGKLIESYWLKGVKSLHDNGNPDQVEFVMYSGDFAQVEKLASAIVTATIRRTSAVVGHDYSGYYSNAQIEHADLINGGNAMDVSEECIEDLKLTVGSPDGSAIEVALYTANGKPVARLNGDLSMTAVKELAAQIEKMRDERAAYAEEIDNSRQNTFRR
jgi:hypothetical protein